MRRDSREEFYKSAGVLWEPVVNDRGYEFLADTPYCPKEGCRTELQNRSDGYFCVTCQRLFPRAKDHFNTKHEASLKWEGYRRRHFPVYLLDAPPTRVVDEDNEDENYWVQARITEGGGKKIAVVYFGKKINGNQNKDDYVQLFVDLDDEQVRFDKSNKNPMKIAREVRAEFPKSTTKISRKEGKANSDPATP